MGFSLPCVFHTQLKKIKISRTLHSVHILVKPNLMFVLLNLWWTGRSLQPVLNCGLLYLTNPVPSLLNSPAGGIGKLERDYRTGQVGVGVQVSFQGIPKVVLPLLCRREGSSSPPAVAAILSDVIIVVDSQHLFPQFIQ
jgi:hypothetical protein